MDSAFAEVPGYRRILGRLSPAALLRQFGSEYWTFFAAAFLFDLGFGLFFFLFNLYLTDLHFDERAVGRITACLTLGNVAGTIPATILARRFGLRPLLLLCFVCAPIFSAVRLVASGESGQIVIALVTGAVLCCWPICFSPTIAALTNDRNRTRGFSIMFATGIGVGTLSGAMGGYVPELLHEGRLHTPVVAGIGIVLLIACGLVVMGAWPILKLRLTQRLPPRGHRSRVFHPFLRRFLPPFLLWNVVTGSFPAFGAIYLQQVLKISLGRIGLVFSASQLMEFVAVIASPALIRRAGLTRGIAISLFGTAIALAMIGITRQATVAVGLYVVYYALMFMCEPGIYNLLMDRIPEEERSTASAVQNLSGALCQAATAAATGSCIVRFGYGAVLFSNAVAAVSAALLFLALATRAASNTMRASPDSLHEAPQSTL